MDLTELSVLICKIVLEIRLRFWYRHDPSVCLRSCMDHVLTVSYVLNCNIFYIMFIHHFHFWMFRRVNNAFLFLISVILNDIFLEIGFYRSGISSVNKSCSNPAYFFYRSVLIFCVLSSAKFDWILNNSESNLKLDTIEQPFWVDQRLRGFAIAFLTTLPPHELVV